MDSAGGFESGTAVSGTISMGGAVASRGFVGDRRLRERAEVSQVVDRLFERSGVASQAGRERSAGRGGSTGGGNGRTPSGLRLDEVQSALVDVRRLRGWVDAVEAQLVARLVEVSPRPERDLADAGRLVGRQAGATVRRAQELENAPELSDALAGGSVTAPEVDAAVARGRGLDETLRPAFWNGVDELAKRAESMTPDVFAERVRRVAEDLERESGADKLERQRKAVRARRWIDRDGMWNLRGRFDPALGVRLSGALDRAIEATFADGFPPEAPDDPLERQQFLAGHALARLMSGEQSGGAGRPEIIVVVDADAPAPVADGRTAGGGVGGGGDPGADVTDEGWPAVDWGIPVELPPEILVELAGVADVCGVVVRNGAVLHAPGRLDLGRTTRLANRAQRRALRALYRGCAIPDCSVPFDRCKIHHVHWWRHGGRTDFDNLLPVCVRHHADIHDRGWIVELGTNRELTLRLPDGSIERTGPPSRRRRRGTDSGGSSGDRGSDDGPD